MITGINILLAIQLVATTLAVIFNNFLIVIVIKYSKQKYGFYKYLIIFFAAFEEFYAVVVLISMPLHLIAENTWLTFTYSGLLSMTPYGILGPMLYCSLYETWVVTVVVHYIYRYLVVCRPRIADAIGHSLLFKFILCVLFFLSVCYCFFCGVYLCSQNHISEKLKGRLTREFNITDTDHVAATMLRLTDDFGNLSVPGVVATGNHYFLVSVSSILIAFCGFSIWREIKRMKGDINVLREASMQRQMFLSLVVQTSVPVIFCHIPTLIGLTFPLLENFSFGPLSPVFTCMTSINKILDPIILLYFIRDYREAVLGLMRKCFRIKEEQVSVIGSSVTEDISRIRTTSNRLIYN